MPWMIKSQLEWLREHAEQGTDKIWRCKKTGHPISQALTGRSIWEKPFTGGGGEVRQVIDIACLGCNPGAEPPEYGKPIYNDALVHVD